MTAATAAATSSILLLMPGDSSVLARIASVMASRRRRDGRCRGCLLPLKATALVIPGGTPPGSEPRRGQYLHTFTSSQTRHQAIRSHPVGRSSRPPLRAARPEETSLHKIVSENWVISVPKRLRGMLADRPAAVYRAGASPRNPLVQTLRLGDERDQPDVATAVRALFSQASMSAVAAASSRRGPIRKILTHLGEPLEPPPVSPARGPPTDWGELILAHDDRDVFQASPDDLPVIDIHSL